MATVNELKFPDATVPSRPGQRVERVSRLAQWAKRVHPAQWKFLLLGADMALILIAFALAYYVRYQLQWFRAVDPVSQVELGAYLPFAVVLLLILPLSFRFSGVYPYRRGRSLI